MPRYETGLWALLVIVTCLSWVMSGNVGLFENVKVAASATLILAFFKTRFVLLDFMELRHAPLAARVFAEAWWIGNCIILLALYWTST